ncbi:MAG: UDP-N-acetylglucosamine--N-acetylmuramyl-(pentapeptide) pyrophosphoryl-undecaprenol N-acetylglucosamine transferase [Firmicutes bacterium]|nr:UDP-N-acetylglucosamine--N-acetylmuramyl-(pentapeptide) pyrophosphoryl-undecaprenol N-acetylglucosamine transferase [Bacillota bacterium]
MLKIKDKRVLVMTGGGTAGHVIPNLALAPLLENEFEIHYIGSRNGIEKKLVKDFGLPYYGISTGKLRRSLSPAAIFKNLAMPFKVLKGMQEAKAYLKRIKPDLVFSKGGFVSYPVVRAASNLGISVILHESDLSLGLANRKSLKYATKILTSFQKTAEKVDGIWTGSPIRQNLYSERPKNAHTNNLLIMGGSLGAKAINDAIKDEICDKWKVLHITGRGKRTNIKHPNYEQIEYTDDMRGILAWADIVVSRAGSGAIFELLAQRKPSILVPLSTGRGDQIENATEVASWGVSLHLPEDKLHTLEFAIETVDKNRVEFTTAIDNLTKIDGTKEIAQIIRHCPSRCPD